MRNKLQGFSSAFPGGWPGIGLLLLRAALGITAFIQGAVYIGGNPTPITSIVGLFAIASGGLLLIGFFTPVACVLAGLAALFLAILSFPSRTSPNLFDAALPTVLLIVVAAAVVFLGPGALSLDARRFGRREIIIPRTPPSRET
jgi:uncharacterized membrane protein YphA (DoxX/SURF4 family)